MSAIDVTQEAGTTVTDAPSPYCADLPMPEATHRLDDVSDIIENGAA